MNAGKTIQISDTIHGTINLSEIEMQVISTSIFNRLHNISQNSTVYLTFPTNRTKRFEHSIGVMELSGRIFFYGLSNSSEKTLSSFFKDIKAYIDEFIDNNILGRNPDLFRPELGDENLSPKKIKNYNNIKINGSIYTSTIPSNITEKFLYTVLYEAVRISALLHDIGHPPFSHITEYAVTAKL